MNKKQRIIKKQKQYRFVIEYLEEHYATDACDQKFQEQWFLKFGGNRKQTIWGAEPVREAASYLKELWQQGILDRGVVTLGINWQPGFPRWVYGYTLREINGDK